jgi:FKBP-type peptidyl-prolyl cis-trans isomerase
MNKLDNKHILKAPLRGLGVISLIILLSFTACNNGEDSTTQWRLDNDAAYKAKQTEQGWKELKTQNVQGPSGVYYKDLTESGVEKGQEHPIQTASVKVNYKGRYYTGTVFDSGTNATFKVSDVVRGFSVALQNMGVGEKWDVCIPYDLGYGAAGYVNPSTYQVIIQGYTTLFFEIELLEINQYPK